MPRMGIEFVFPAASLLCATLSAVYDVRSRRIPNFITLPAMVFGLILHAALGGWRQLVTAAAGGLICGFIFFVFYLAGGMGAGDVKLITAAGCIAGLPLNEAIDKMRGPAGSKITLTILRISSVALSDQVSLDGLAAVMSRSWKALSWELWLPVRLNVTLAPVAVKLPTTN